MQDVYEIETSKEQQIETIVDNGANKLIEIEKQINKTKESAKQALEKAEEVRNIKTRLLFNSESINELKETCTMLADALVASAEAQLKMQEYQKMLAIFTKELFNISISSVAASDAAIKRLTAIACGNKQQPLGEETKKQIDLIIKQIKEQQSMIAKIDDIKNKLSQQQQDIYDLTLKIDAIAISKDAIETPEGVIVLSGALKDSLKQLSSMCHENNSIIHQSFSDISTFISQISSALTNTFLEKHFEQLSLISEKAGLLGNMINSSINQLYLVLQSIKEENDALRSLLESTNVLIENKSEQINSIIEELQKRDDRNNVSLCKHRIINYVLIALNIALAIAILFILIFK